MFKPVELEWQGKAYSLPANRVLRTIAAVEEVVTLGELATDAQRRKVKLAQIAQAFGVLLRAAGADVTDDDVYAGMFASGASVQAAEAAIQMLLALMIPPSAYSDAKAHGSASVGNAVPAAASPSRRSRSRSAPSASAPRNSGG